MSCSRTQHRVSDESQTADSKGTDNQSAQFDLRPCYKHATKSCFLTMRHMYELKKSISFCMLGNFIMLLMPSANF